MRLHYGPWVGEFGFELVWWSPAVRHLARLDHARGDTVVVSAPIGSAFLYEFADEFVPLDWEPSRSFGHSGRLRSPAPHIEADAHVAWGDINPKSRTTTREHRDLGVRPDWSAPDVMAAFRPPKGRRYEGKAYPPAMCEELVARLERVGLSVGCFGGPDNWRFGMGPDYRGRPLGEQCSLLAGTACAVGPSSGTMHLASLCRTPYVTWYPLRPEHSEEIHKSAAWNPFGTEVVFLRGTAPPAPQDAAAAVDGLVRPRPPKPGSATR